MKFRPWSSVVAATLFTTLAMLAGVTPQKAAAQETAAKHHHYKLFDVGTFGGTTSLFSNPGSVALNNRGMATGMANTSVSDPFPNNCYFDCWVDHSFVWKDGVTTDLGNLPGGPSSFPVAINNLGLIVGQSQNDLIDPLTGAPEVRGVLWRNGQVIDLGTLGGNASSANAINDLGQVVGSATNVTLDPFANAPQSACQVLETGLFPCSSFTFSFNALFSPSTTETHAFLWQDGFMRDLGTLGGPDSSALINNNQGEVAGWSYTSFVANPSTGTPSVDPFLWSPEDGKVTDLGSLGGTFGAPFFMNNLGQVVGVSNLPGDLIVHPFLWSKSEGMKDLGTLGGTYGHPDWINDAGEVVGFSKIAGVQAGGHAFLWRRGVMTDLGTIGTDPVSEAFNINSLGQIVGGTFIWFGPDLHGFLSENRGPIVDLNKLVLPGSNVRVATGLLINDLGEIAGRGILPNGDEHAVVLIPCDENHPKIAGCDYSLVDAATVQSSAAPLPTANTPATQALPTKRNRRSGVPAPK